MPTDGEAIPRIRGLLAGGIVMYARPNALYGIAGACLLLVLIGSALMRNSGNFMTRFSQKREEQEAAKSNPFESVIGVPADKGTETTAQ
jgi:hypothetical protein